MSLSHSRAFQGRKTVTFTINSFSITFKALLSICDSKKRDQRSKIENTRGLIDSLKGDTQNNLTKL